jgi:hypothetical protein
VSDNESVVIKIGSARYVVPIINLIRDRMWEYGQYYLGGRAQFRNTSICMHRNRLGGNQVTYIMEFSQIDNFILFNSQFLERYYSGLVWQ